MLRWRFHDGALGRSRLGILRRDGSNRLQTTSDIPGKPPSRAGQHRGAGSATSPDRCRVLPRMRGAAVGAVARASQHDPSTLARPSTRSSCGLCGVDAWRRSTGPTWRPHAPVRVAKGPSRLGPGSRIILCCAGLRCVRDCPGRTITEGAVRRFVAARQDECLLQVVRSFACCARSGRTSGSAGMRRAPPTAPRPGRRRDAGTAIQPDQCRGPIRMCGAGIHAGPTAFGRCSLRTTFASS